MAATKSATVVEVTDSYIATLNPNNLPADDAMEADLLAQTCAVFEIENTTRTSGTKWKIPDALFPYQIMMLMFVRYHIANVAFAGLAKAARQDVLCIYKESGDSKGIYVEDERFLIKAIQQFNANLKMHEIRDIIELIRARAPRVVLCQNANLVPLNNGIFDYRTKTLMQFSPDYVFTAKAAVNYNPLAVNVQIREPNGEVWNVEGWMKSLSDDPEIVELFWQIIGAALRSRNNWGKAILFQSSTGNNGKGTLCSLIKSIVGEGAWASIPVSRFADEFALTDITHVNVVIGDENDVGTFIDRAGNFKAMVSGDSLFVNRKNQNPITVTFHGLIVECFNDTPRVRDRTDSFARRLLVVPFERCFTGMERKYIKDDYLRRKDVLEYVVHKVLNMNYDEFIVPQKCKVALEKWSLANDPVRQFLDDVLPRVTWRLLPGDFLYDLYRGWFKKNQPSGSVLGKNQFLNDCRERMTSYPEWSLYKKTRSDCRMDFAEPLICEFNLTEWMNPNYGGSDASKRCVPELKESYYGFEYIGAGGVAGNDDDDENKDGEE